MSLSNLSNLDLDMLCEAFNIGAHKSAKALSDLASQSAELSIPKVKEIDTSLLYSALGFEANELITCIRLPMTSDINGHAELVFSKNHSDQLASLCIPRNIPIEALDMVKEEMLQEIANILLHACFGTIANMLNFGVDLNTPSIHTQSASILALQASNNGEDTKALAVNACLTLHGMDIKGFIILYFSDDSMIKIKEVLSTYMSNLGIQA